MTRGAPDVAWNRRGQAGWSRRIVLQTWRPVSRGNGLTLDSGRRWLSTMFSAEERRREGRGRRGCGSGCDARRADRDSADGPVQGEREELPVKAARGRESARLARRAGKERADAQARRESACRLRREVRHARQLRRSWRNGARRDGGSRRAGARRRLLRAVAASGPSPKKRTRKMESARRIWIRCYTSNGLAKQAEN